MEWKCVFSAVLNELTPVLVRASAVDSWP